MAYTNKNLISGNLKKALRTYRELYEQTAEASRQEALAKLPAGATKLPEAGRILDDAHRLSFLEQGEAIKAKALSELDEWRKSVTAAKTDAPSDEALRAIQAFKMRNPKAMTREEFSAEAQSLADRYGGCYQAYQVIHDYAAENGARIKPHALAADVESFTVVEKAVRDYINPQRDVKYGGPSAGKEDFISWCFDDLMEDS